MKRLISGSLRASQKALYYVSKVIFVFAVIVTIIQVYRSFTLPDEETVNFTEALEMSRTLNQQELDKMRENSELASTVVPIYESALCSTLGEFCHDVTEEYAQNNNTLNTISNFMFFPIYNPPASGTYATYTAFNNAGIIPQAYAQSETPRGIGFTMIQPLSVIWKHFRNIAFLVLAIYLVIVGFLIMFRMKLDAQTVITIENSIPRVVLTIILIAFSFAIAGFLIDFMYIAIGLIVGIVAGLGIEDLPADILLKDYMFASGQTILRSLYSYQIWDLVWHLPNAIVSILGPTIRTIMSFIGSAIAWYYILGPLSNRIIDTFNIEGEAEGSIVALAGKLKLTGPMKLFLWSPLAAFLWIGVGLILGIWIAKLAMGLVILFSAIILSVRIFILLLKAYTRILLMIIFSPFILLAEVFPGKSAFKKWFRTLLGELATFPIVISIFLIGAVIFKSGFLVQGCEELHDQVFTRCQSISFPFFYGLDPRSFTVIVGFGLLFITPEWVKTIKKAINPQPIDFPSAGIGTFFAGVTGGAKTAAGNFTKYTGTGGLNWAARAIVNRAPEGIRKKGTEILDGIKGGKGSS